MTPERWRQVEGVYDAVVTRPAPEQASVLASLCAGDEGLRHEVESLLAHAGGASAFLATPAFSAASVAGEQALVGRRFGAYLVRSFLDAGGMGEVYRAHDEQLGREVAIKILPRSSASDPERLARFDREARLLAALNHPHIGAIYGVEPVDGRPALVLELVEGETLAERIAAGRLPVAEALTIARQIAEALEAAHERGIVHRDLKPANIRITPEGVVKVLDFGLAKAAAGDAGASEASHPPTVTVRPTREGMVLGTAAYMSPEQARGEVVDKRTDIWAFGCVLYEMLTGLAAFAAPSTAETLSEVLTSEPDWQRLPSDTPDSVRRLLRRCLAKDRTRRLTDTHDARLEIDDGLSDTVLPQTGSGAALPQQRTRGRLTWASGLGLGGLIVAAMVAWATRSVSVPPETTRTLLSVAPMAQGLGGSPLEQRVGGQRPSRTAVALSPDGKTLVFGAIWGGEAQLHARAMDQLDATLMPGTQGGSSPFFSPDGQWVGFWSGGEIRKVPLSGGPPVTLCKAAAIFGASWGSDGTIVFATDRNGGLWRVSAAGGVPDVLTTLQPGEYSHRLPHMLPGGHAVIFTISKAANRWDNTQIVVRSLATGKQTVLVTGGTDGRYVPTGHLVYVRLGTLMAVPFDSRRLVVTGDARGLVDDVMQAANRNASDMSNTLAAQVTVSDTGALVYVTGGAVPGADRTLVWVDRQGARQTLPAPPRPYRTPRVSSDGLHVAVSTQQDIGRVWRYDIARGALGPITVDGQSGYGIFSHDGKRIVFRSGAAGGEDNLYWKAADGSGAVERLTTSARSQTPGSWSPDGTTLAFVEEGNTLAQNFFQFDIWVLSIGDRKTHAVIQTAANEMSPEFSPDGRWLAYVSSESGRGEVYVQAYPGPGERHLISTTGGEQPAWGRSGRELFYVQAGAPGSRTLMSVRIRTAPAFLAGTPETLFESRDLQSNWGRSYDVAPDGRFLLTLRREQPTAPAQMILVQNWFEELKRLVPVN